MDNKEELSGERVCAIWLQESGCIDPNYKPWSINIPPRIPIQQNVSQHKYLFKAEFHFELF